MSIHPDEIITGCARGADAIARRVADDLGIPCTVYKAKWDEHGKRAGYLRNIEMLDASPDEVLAFWDGQSKGTKHTITEAEKRGIPVRVKSL